jgi:broad specificity phosphatase PhoE
MATSLKVMIVRHGEKPAVKHVPPLGVTKDGQEDFESLTVRGWQRAGGLACLFRSPHNPALVTPELIYASKPREDVAADAEPGSKSRRPLETITPLAKRLGISPNLDFGKDQEAALVAQVLKQKEPVLIAWQHEAICAIAEAIVGDNPPKQPIPTKWPDDRYDLVWVLDPPAGNGKKWQFTQVPQQLLNGDSDTVIT